MKSRPVNTQCSDQEKIKMKKYFIMLFITFGASAKGLPLGDFEENINSNMQDNGFIEIDDNISSDKIMSSEVPLSNGDSDITKEVILDKEYDIAEINNPYLSESHDDNTEIMPLNAPITDEIMETAPNSSIAAAFNIRKRKKHYNINKFAERRYHSRNPSRRYNYYPRIYSYYPALYGYRKSCQ